MTLKVVVPRSTPRDSKIFVAGNHPKLGDWDPGKVELRRENDSVWTTTGKFSKGATLEYKVTRGSWNKQAIYKDGVIPGNMTLTVLSDSIIAIYPMSWSGTHFTAGGGITGTVKYHRGVKGDGLRYDRDVIVWLPPSYAKDESRTYPVLYMHDGQNVFDPSTSFIGYDWHVDEVADSLIRSGKMQEIIVVGIYNSPDRGPEYSNTELGRAYGRFVVNRVKPMIDSTYRTKPDRRNTAVMGSSLGGHISFLLTWWYPDVFYQAACLSPAFYSPVLDKDAKVSFFGDRTTQQVRSFDGGKREVRLYMDCGGVGMEQQLKKGMDIMIEALVETGYEEGVDFEYFYDETAEHNERAWAKRLWRPLRFLFGK